MNQASYEVAYAVFAVVGVIGLIVGSGLVREYRAFRKARRAREMVERELTLMGAAMGRKEIH